MTNKPSPESRLAWLLDECIRLPGGYRIGLDGLIGLIPGIGDLTGGLLASLMLLQAKRLQAPTSLLLTMALNILLDSVVGSIPVAGDLFDFAWKANTRNARLLALWQVDPEAAKRQCLGSNLGWLLAATLAACLLLWLIWSSLQMFWSSLGVL